VSVGVFKPDAKDVPEAGIGLVDYDEAEEAAALLTPVAAPPSTSSERATGSPTLEHSQTK